MSAEPSQTGHIQSRELCWLCQQHGSELDNAVFAKVLKAPIAALYCSYWLFAWLWQIAILGRQARPKPD